MKTVLLVGFHFPPMRGSSGLQRLLKFATYLPEHGWRPIVLSANRRAYPQSADDQLAEIPESLLVERAFALDASRHFALAGRYPGFLARPDRWRSWRLAAIRAGLRLIREHDVQALFSTYPIPTAHRIGLELQRRSGLPWVADFRDSMTEEDYPTDPQLRAQFLDIEQATVRHAARCVFTTPGTRQMYQRRYPDLPDARWARIPNGFDEQNFQRAEAAPPYPRSDGVTTLVHSGVLYPHERNPAAFFNALATCREQGVFAKRPLRVVLRATDNDAVYRPVLKRLGLEDIVELAPSVAYQDALREMLVADGLLLFQGKTCNHQVPAKVYEYLRARRPVLALLDSAGDTAAVLTEAGVGTLADMESADAIGVALKSFLHGIETDRHAVMDRAATARYSRQSHAGELAEILDTVCGLSGTGI